MLYFQFCTVDLEIKLLEKMIFGLTKHQSYLIWIVALVCIGFSIYIFTGTRAPNLFLTASNWQSRVGSSTKHNPRKQPGIGEKVIDKINTFSLDIDYLIIQAWWPEPEQIYANKKDAILKHHNSSQEALRTRIENGCKNINTNLRQKYFSNSAIVYVGNIDWMKANTPYCFEFDNIYSLALKYDDLMYKNEIEQYMNPECASKFSKKIESRLQQRYARIWLNKLNIMYWASVHAVKLFELRVDKFFKSKKKVFKDNININTATNNRDAFEDINIDNILPRLDIFDSDKVLKQYSIPDIKTLSQKQIDFLRNIKLVWIDFGFKQKHMNVLTEYWSNIEVFNATMEDIHRLHTMNSLRYGEDRLAVVTEKKQFQGWFLNEYCHTAPVFVASVMITDYITLTEIIQSYHQTLVEMFSKIKIAKLQSFAVNRNKNRKNNKNKKNKKNGNRMIDAVTCDCFDEEAVFATMLKNHGFDGNETNFAIVSDVNWRWKNMGFTHRDYSLSGVNNNQSKNGKG